MWQCNREERRELGPCAGRRLPSPPAFISLPPLCRPCTGRGGNYHPDGLVGEITSSGGGRWSVEKRGGGGGGRHGVGGHRPSRCGGGKLVARRRRTKSRRGPLRGARAPGFCRMGGGGRGRGAGGGRGNHRATRRGRGIPASVPRPRRRAPTSWPQLQVGGGRRATPSLPHPRRKVRRRRLAADLPGGPARRYVGRGARRFAPRQPRPRIGHPDRHPILTACWGGGGGAAGGPHESAPYPHSHRPTGVALRVGHGLVVPLPAPRTAAPREILSATALCHPPHTATRAHLGEWRRAVADRLPWGPPPSLPARRSGGSPDDGGARVRRQRRLPARPAGPPLDVWRRRAAHGGGHDRVSGLRRVGPSPPVASAGGGAGGRCGRPAPRGRHPFPPIPMSPRAGAWCPPFSGGARRGRGGCLVCGRRRGLFGPVPAYRPPRS